MSDPPVQLHGWRNAHALGAFVEEILFEYGKRTGLALVDKRADEEARTIDVDFVDPYLGGISVKGDKHRDENMALEYELVNVDDDLQPLVGTERLGYLLKSQAQFLFYAYPWAESGFRLYVALPDRLRAWWEPRRYQYAKDPIQNVKQGRVEYIARCDMVPIALMRETPGIFIHPEALGLAACLPQEYVKRADQWALDHPWLNIRNWRTDPHHTSPNYQRKPRTPRTQRAA